MPVLLIKTGSAFSILSLSNTNDVVAFKLTEVRLGSMILSLSPSIVHKGEHQA